MRNRCKVCGRTFRARATKCDVCPKDTKTRVMKESKKRDMVAKERQELKKNGLGWFLNTPLWNQWGKLLCKSIF